MNDEEVLDQPEQNQQQVQENLDYRDLLSSQIMTEQAKANASKYVAGGLQASGIGQTGVAQSVLAGIEGGYQSTLAQNVNQYMMMQDVRGAEQLSMSQQNAMNTATTLLNEPDLSQEEFQYIYDTYFGQMSSQDKQTFQFLYDRRARELGYESPTASTTETANIDTFFQQNVFNFRGNEVGGTQILNKYESFQRLIGGNYDENTIRTLYTKDLGIYNNAMAGNIDALKGGNYSAQDFSDMFIRMASSSIGSRNDARYFADDVVETMLFGAKMGEEGGGWVRYDSISGRLKIQTKNLPASVSSKLKTMGFTLSGDSKFYYINKNDLEGEISYAEGKGLYTGGELVAQVYAKFLYDFLQQ